MIEARWIATVLQASWTQQPAVQSFTGMGIDARKIEAGHLFVALRGATRHGQEFLAQAQAMGAAGALVEARQESDLPQIVVPDTALALRQLGAARRTQMSAPVIALTGSSGKTSTKELLAHLLGDACYKTPGNFNNLLGVPLTLLHAPAQASAHVIEAGISLRGEMAQLAAIIQPQAALLTLIGSAHLENFVDRNAIAEEKGALLHAVPASGLCVLHARELAYPTLRHLTAQTLVLGTNLQRQALAAPLPPHYTWVDTTLEETASGWILILDGGIYPLPLWSPGMAQNAALCVATAVHMGQRYPHLAIDKTLLMQRLMTWRGAALRGEWVKMKDGADGQRIYLDAYNCNPEGLIDSLWRFQRLSRAQVGHLYVLSAMGELGSEGIPLQRMAASHVQVRRGDRVCLVGGGLEPIIQGLKDAGTTDSQITICPTVDDVRPIIQAHSGDIFIKGSHYGSRLFTLASLCLPISST